MNKTTLRKISGLLLVLVMILALGTLFSCDTELRNAPILESIEIASLPDKLEYKPGEDLDYIGLVVKKVFSDGTKTELAEDEYTCSSDYNKEVLGEYTVTVKLKSDESKTATFKVENCVKITLSIEAFSIGKGWIVEPVVVKLTQAEYADTEGNGDAVLLRVLDSLDLTYNADADMFLGFIGNIKGIHDDVAIPSYLLAEISSLLNTANGSPAFADENKLSSSDYCAALYSGFLTSVNDAFLEVSYSEYYLEDGDVFRVQFSLACGADIGNDMGGWVTLYYPVAEKAELTALVAEFNSYGLEKGDAYDVAVAILQVLDASQEDVDNAFDALMADYGD